MEIYKVLSNRLQIAQTKLLFIGKVIITQSNGGTNERPPRNVQQFNYFVRMFFN
jgi:hypothetical protein